MARTKRDGSEKPKVKPHYIKPKRPPVELNKKYEHVCPWCKKAFSTEKIMLTHLCEQRRRFDQKDSVHCRYGLQAFLSIYSRSQGGSHGKTEEDFRNSTFYMACVKWGRYVIDVHCFDPMNYLNWLQKLQVPIDSWCKDEVYECWIQQLVYEENIWDATERSIKSMNSWAEEFNEVYENYFRKAGTARILFDIKRARLNGIVIYCSESGKEWINKLSKVDLEDIWPWISTERWGIRIQKFSDDVSNIKSICGNAGL